MTGSGGVETIKQGSFVELRGRPWLVEALHGDETDLQTLSLSCISDDAQGERLEVLWDAEIGATPPLLLADNISVPSSPLPGGATSLANDTPSTGSGGSPPRG